MHTIGIIHARGGSKRVPLKNIRKLNGIPLIGYLITAALNSKLLDKLIVSSDHEDIIRVSREFGAEVPFVRPESISSDCPSELVTQHAVSYMEKKFERKVDIAVTFQPTTPFCLPEDIDSVIQILMNNERLGSVFSASPISERPEWMFKSDDGCNAVPIGDTVFSGDVGVSQNLEKIYYPNGGIYATLRKNLFNENAIICQNTGIHVMPFERSVDIDEMIDFHYAEFLLSNQIVQLPHLEKIMSNKNARIH